MEQQIGAISGTVIERSSVVLDTYDRYQLTSGGHRYRGGGAAIPTRMTELALPLITAPLTLTDALQADGFIAADTSYQWKVDLASFTQVRLVAKVKTVSASANSPKLQLRYQATASVTVANLLIMGATSVEISMFTGTTHEDSGWIELVAGAKIDNCFLGLMNIGGDGTADPVVNQVTAYFR